MKLVSVTDRRGNRAVYGSRIVRRCPAISHATIESAQLQLDMVRACADHGDERGAEDYLARAVATLITELRLARKIRRASR